MPAKASTLNAMHEKLANELLDRIENGEEETVVDGETVKTVKKRASPALLNVARQMLKDNGIEAKRTPANPIGRLADALPTVEEDPVAEFYSN